MAAVEPHGPSKEIENPSNENMQVDECAFSSDYLDKFLKSVSVDGVVLNRLFIDEEPDYHCLESGDNNKDDISSISSLPPTVFTIKQFEGPKPITCFNNSIKLASSWKYLKAVKFVQQPLGGSEISALSKLRFPAGLESLYVKHMDSKNSLARNEDYKNESSEENNCTQTPFKRRKRTRKGRLSLNKQEAPVGDCFKKRNLLPTDEDLSSVFDKVFPSRRIPYLYRCYHNSSGCSTKCAKQVKNFTLFMEIKNTPGHPLPSFVRENINSVKGESCIIDHVSALIAVTTVKNKEPSRSRLFLPISHHLTSRIECMTNVAPYAADQTSEVDLSVSGVVNDTVDFVVRQREYDDYNQDKEDSIDDQDPCENTDQIAEDSSVTSDTVASKPKRRLEKNKTFRELKKLANVSVTYEEELKSETSEVADDYKCLEPHCSLGCVCSSLNEKHSPVEHCGKISCVLGCKCSNGSRDMYIDCGELAKDEKTWHQTVIRKRNNVLEIKSGIDRSKRESKMPSKYKNAFVGEEMKERLRRPQQKSGVSPNKKMKFDVALTKRSIDNNKTGRCTAAPTIGTSKKHGATLKKIEEPHQNVGRSSGPNQIKKPPSKRYIKMIKESIDRRLSLSIGGRTSNLSDVFIWCTIHDKYDCICTNFIMMMKNFSLLFKPPRSNKWAASKCLGKVTFKIPEHESRQVVLFDQGRHCSRSVGSLYNYRARNRSTEFKQLSRCLLDNGVLSFSNGFIKARPIATIRPVCPIEIVQCPDVTKNGVAGVGNVESISSRSYSSVEENSHVNVGGPTDVSRFIPPDDFNYSSDEEASVQDGSILFESDLSGEFIPKPKTRKGLATPQLCFSVYKKRPSDVSLPETINHQSDSDEVELMEDEVECYSVSSSSEMIEDGGTVSDISSDHEEDTDIQTTGKVLENAVNSSSFPVTTATEPPERSPSASNKASCEIQKISIDRDEDDYMIESDQMPKGFITPKPTSELLTNVESSKNRRTASESTKGLRMTSGSITLVDEECGRDHKRLVAPQTTVNGGLTNLEDRKRPRTLIESLEKPRSASPMPKHAKVDHNSETKIIDYPKLGLFCMSQPDLGYLRVKESTPGNLIIEDPADPNAFRLFKNSKEASEYMKKVVGLCINPEFADSEWAMVTKGVLEKYRCKRFDERQLAVDTSLPKIPRTPIPEVGAKRKTEISHGNKTLVCKPQYISSAQFLNPRYTLAATAKPDPSQATFPSMSVANSVLDKALPIKGNLRPSIGQTQPSRPPNFTVLQNRNPGYPFLRVNSVTNRQPILMHNNGKNFRTITIRSPSSSTVLLNHNPNLNGMRQITVPNRMTHPSGYRIVGSTTSASTLKCMASPSPSKMSSPSVKLPAVIHNVSGTASALPSTTLASKVSTPIIVATSSISSSDHSAPSPQSVKKPPTTNSAYFIESFTAEPTPAQPSTSSATLVVKPCRTNVLPKPQGTSSLQSVQFRQRIPPKRADVIIPRKDGFATLISPTPSESSPPIKVHPSPDGKVLNGAVLPKVDKEAVKGYICYKKFARTSSSRSVLKR